MGEGGIDERLIHYEEVHVTEEMVLYGEEEEEEGGDGEFLKIA